MAAYRSGRSGAWSAAGHDRTCRWACISGPAKTRCDSGAGAQPEAGRRYLSHQAGDVSDRPGTSHRLRTSARRDDRLSWRATSFPSRRRCRTTRGQTGGRRAFSPSRTGQLPLIRKANVAWPSGTARGGLPDIQLTGTVPLGPPMSGDDAWWRAHRASSRWPRPKGRFSRVQSLRDACRSGKR
jgi:hypothetical protein